MPAQCEIVEVTNIEDASGYPCGRDASECCDCGSHVCDSHAESCEFCDEVFCLTCLAFHIRDKHQKKPAPADRHYRKSA